GQICRGRRLGIPLLARFPRPPARCRCSRPRALFPSRLRATSSSSPSRPHDLGPAPLLCTIPAAPLLCFLALVPLLSFLALPRHEQAVASQVNGGSANGCVQWIRRRNSSLSSVFVLGMADLEAHQSEVEKQQSGVGLIRHRVVPPTGFHGRLSEDAISA
ncbi:unnamed protein product, partial [Urochloa humidicola]